MDSSTVTRLLGKLQEKCLRFGTGLWLILLYPFLIWCVVGTLSAHGYHDKVKTVRDPDNKPLSMPTITRLADQLMTLENEITRVQKDIGEREAVEAKLKSERVQKKDLLDQAETLAQKHQTELKHRLQQLGVTFPAPLTHFRQIQDAYHADPAVRTAVSDDPAAGKLWTAYQEKILLAENAETEYDDARAKHEDARLEKEISAKQITLQQDLRKELLQDARIDDIVNELAFMRHFQFDIFATMPGQHLTLLLTLCMGALGSLIFITQEYLFGTGGRPFTWYLFRPFLGMVTAVAIFILAKAGQISISDVSLSEGMSENLNPYFISFLAIISGLLSEHAIKRIQQAGESIFKPDADSEPPREKGDLAEKPPDI